MVYMVYMVLGGNSLGVISGMCREREREVEKEREGEKESYGEL